MQEKEHKHKVIKDYYNPSEHEGIQRDSKEYLDSITQQIFTSCKIFLC